jgi:hypothetical protein
MMQLASSRSIRSRAVLLRYSLDPPAQRPADGPFLGEVVRRNAAGLEPVYSGDLSKILTRAGEQDRFVYKGGYYFAWKRGHFIRTYETLDHAVESLIFRPTKKAH